MLQGTLLLMQDTLAQEIFKRKFLYNSLKQVKEIDCVCTSNMVVCSVFKVKLMV